MLFPGQVPPGSTYSAASPSLPSLGQNTAGINYMQPQGFNIPGSQSDIQLKRGIAQPLQTAPPLPASSGASNGMASALMNPAWRA